QNKYSVDFSQYKQTTIKRRVWRRMVLNKVKSADEYISVLREKNGEMNSLYNDLLINVTSFFREPDLEKILTQKIFPALIKDKKPAEPLRIWIPACSTGEEAITFAIYFYEYIGDNAFSSP